MVKLLFLSILMMFVSITARSEDEAEAAPQSNTRERVVVKYKKYEKIDLGGVSIKGKIITPGDISVRERKVERFSTPTFYREDFDEKIYDDYNNIR